MQQFARHKRRWKGNVIFDFKGTGWKDVEMIRLVGIRDYWRSHASARGNFLIKKKKGVKFFTYQLNKMELAPWS